MLATVHVYQHDAVVAIVLSMDYLSNSLIWLAVLISQRTKGDLFRADKRNSQPFERAVCVRQTQLSQIRINDTVGNGASQDVCLTEELGDGRIDGTGIEGF